MTDNITRLYELAGVEKDCIRFKSIPQCTQTLTECNECVNYTFPPFTAEKQLELIKWIQLSDNIDTLQMFHHVPNNRWCFIVELLPEFSNIPTERLHCSHEQFEQALASLVTNLWNDLTDEQKAEIKRILE